MKPYLKLMASVHVSMDYGVSVLGGPLSVMQVSWAASKFKATSYCSVHPIILSASLRLFQYHQNLSTSGCKVLSKTSTGRCEIPLDPKPSLCADDGLLEELSVEVEHPSTGQSFSAITYLGEPVRIAGHSETVLRWHSCPKMRVESIGNSMILTQPMDPEIKVCTLFSPLSMKSQQVESLAIGQVRIGALVGARQHVVCDGTVKSNLG